MIRLFAAITLPADIATALGPRQKGILGARWRPIESLHITLRFFGPVPESRADDIDSALSAVAGPAFDLRLEGVGVFGEGAEMRAVWAGITQSEPLARLARLCERAARTAGLRGERRAWRPHVTLAYLRGAAPAEVGAWVQRNNLLRSETFGVGRFGLFSSWTGEAGSVYRLERAYPLS